MTHTAPPTRRWIRPAALLLSVALHAGLLWWSTHRPSPPPPERPRESVNVVIREKPAQPPPSPVAAPVPIPQQPPIQKTRPRPTPVPSPPAASTPVPDRPSEPVVTPPAEIPPSVAEVRPPVAPAPSAPPGPSSSPPGRPLGALRLFDPDVIGRSIARTAPSAPAGPGRAAGGNDPNSLAAEQARVGARLQEQLDMAVAGANVSAGFVSACDDGLDNNIDGEIDCADPGCRQLSICDTTGVYEDEHPVGLPDGGGSVSRMIDTRQEGRVRKLSLRVDVLHGRPGDLSLTLVAPDGRRAVLRIADGDQAFKKAYYVRPFIGLPASGRWTLEVEDQQVGVRGVLRGWRLYLTS